MLSLGVGLGVAMEGHIFDWPGPYTFYRRNLAYEYGFWPEKLVCATPKVSEENPPPPMLPLPPSLASGPALVSPLPSPSLARHRGSTPTASATPADPLARTTATAAPRTTRAPRCGARRS